MKKAFSLGPFLAFLSLLGSFSILFSQKTQALRGSVIARSTRLPLEGATVRVVGSEPVLGAATDASGSFLIEKVAVGRVALEANFIGYEPFRTPEFLHSSTRPTTIEIELSEGSVGQNEVKIVASKNAFEPLNELAVVSARSFSVEEMDRTPAAINDPGRMAFSLPGVQRGDDDNENEIVVRGNSPLGTLWRLEGADIPNPNHFAAPASSGGGVTVFSAQLLSRSDFFTGGFPAEYGNAIAAVFDMHFRAGDFFKRAHRAKIGLLGIDFATEGPMKKGRSSYLVNYRYSTLGLLNKAGFYVVGERVANDFQDLSFNLAFNSADNRRKWTVFGIGGFSREHYEPVKKALRKAECLGGNECQDRVEDANMGAVGTTFTQILNEKKYWKMTLVATASEIDWDYDTLDLMDETRRYRYREELHLDRRLVATAFLVNKISATSTLKTGLILNQIFYDFEKETKERGGIFGQADGGRLVSAAGKGATQTAQAYATLNQKMGEKASFNAGFHAFSLLLNRKTVIDPRLSFRYELSKSQNLSLAWGIFSQMLPLSAYNYVVRDSATGALEKVNFDLPMLRSQHLIAGWNFFSKNRWRVGAEFYLQQLKNVPVDLQQTYWFLNDEQGFPQTRMLPDGKGLNYGIDFTVERQFSNKFFLLGTFSWLESRCEMADGRRFNTTFGTRFSSALTAGREFFFSKKGRALQIGSRLVWSGGQRFTPPDISKSTAANAWINDFSRLNEDQQPNYWRIDSRILYRWNGRKLAGQVGLDIQNTTNRINKNNERWDQATSSVIFTSYATGFIPVLHAQFDF